MKSGRQRSGGELWRQPVAQRSFRRKLVKALAKETAALPRGLGRPAAAELPGIAALVAETYGFDPNDLPGPDVGADTPAWLATSHDVEGVSGRFFVDRKAVHTAPHTTDPRRGDRLWNESARLVGLPPGLRFLQTAVEVSPG